MDLIRTLKALADPLRLRVLAAVAEDELTVGEIREVVEAVQSSVSRNLAILRDAGLVRDRKEGTNVYFSLRRDMPAQSRELFRVLARRLAELPAAKEDQARLRECRRRRIQRSRNYFESVAGDWERIRKNYFDARVSSLAIEKLVPPNLTVADIGCGTGSLSLELARLAKKVIAVDLSREMIRQANRVARERASQNIVFRLGDAEKLPLEDRSVDAAFCVLVLHFLEQPAKAVLELCRILRPGGPVILVDLVPHGQEWMREEMAHRWLGFERSAVEAWLRAGGVPQVEYELTGAYAGGKMTRNGKRPVEIFVARGIVPGPPAHRHSAKK
ncbi:MAG: metalloregulator ArsR/SmtB family transcription factor [Deltaproteobacteria bacterium]|nr:metalloregulator ArsR/SmtB family transcription factor [Deltaproteobacteria bacterium]